MLSTVRIYICPFFGQSHSFLHQCCRTHILSDETTKWGFCLIRWKIFCHVISSGFIISTYGLHLVTCLSCSKKKRKQKGNHALKTVTCCPFDVILYLSKNYLTRSPSWDEHISFSRVSWPTSRHQVNTSFQYLNESKWTCWGLLNGSSLRIIPAVWLVAEGYIYVFEFCIHDT